MQTLQQSPQLFASQYETYHPNNHIEQIKKSSKTLSRYIDQSPSIEKPHNTILIDDTVNPKSVENYSDQQNHANTYAYNNSQNNLGKVVSRLQTRIQSTEVKIASLTNIVKLLQKYSETKDDQYEKQKENALFAKTVGQRVHQIQTLELENKIKEFNVVSKKIKKQIEEVTELKHKLELNLDNFAQMAPLTQGDQRKFTTNRSKKSQKSPTSQGSYLELQELAGAFEDMEQRLRDEINKKMEICLRQIKKVSVGTGEVNGVDQNLFEEQINALNFAINRVENECTRNKMVLEKQMEEILSGLGSVWQGKGDDLPRALSQQVEMKTRDKSEERNKARSGQSRRKSDSPSVSRQKRQKSSKVKELGLNVKSMIAENKKAKQEELQLAIRRKKQIKEKLKSQYL